MSIRRAIDHAITQGSKHIRLSPRQYHYFTRGQVLTKVAGKVVYRGAVIGVWDTTRRPLQ